MKEQLDYFYNLFPSNNETLDNFDDDGDGSNYMIKLGGNALRGVRRFATWCQDTAGSTRARLGRSLLHAVMLL